MMDWFTVAKEITNQHRETLREGDEHGTNVRKLRVAMSALEKLHTRLHTTVDDVGCAILRRIIEDARYDIAVIDGAAKRAAEERR
jgi:hypothetical protein